MQIAWEYFFYFLFEQKNHRNILNFALQGFSNDSSKRVSEISLPAFNNKACCTFTAIEKLLMQIEKYKWRNKGSIDSFCIAHNIDRATEECLKVNTSVLKDDAFYCAK